MDPELRRVLEESMRTYQQEMGQTGAEAKQDAGEGAEESRWLLCAGWNVVARSDSGVAEGLAGHEEEGGEGQIAVVCLLEQREHQLSNCVAP